MMKTRPTEALIVCFFSLAQLIGCGGNPMVNAIPVDPNAIMNMPVIGCSPISAPVGFRINNGVFNAGQLMAGSPPGYAGAGTTLGAQPMMPGIPGATTGMGPYGQISIVQAGGGTRFRTQPAAGAVPVFNMSLDYFNDTTGMSGSAYNGAAYPGAMTGGYPATGAVYPGQTSVYPQTTVGTVATNPYGPQVVDGFGTVTLSAATQAQIQAVVPYMAQYGSAFPTLGAGFTPGVTGMPGTTAIPGAVGTPYAQPGINQPYGGNIVGQTACISGLALQAFMINQTINRVLLYVYLNNTTHGITLVY